VEDQPGFRMGTEAPESAEPGSAPLGPPSVPPSPSSPAQRHGPHRGWIAAVVLIVIGIVFLIKNMGWADWSFDNWWALFILIPAVGSFGNAWSSYVSAGRRLDASVGRSAMFGILFVAITVIFLFDAWDEAWPVILIIIGLGLVFGWRKGRTKRESGRQ
jgi:hypothetical protein